MPTTTRNRRCLALAAGVILFAALLASPAAAEGSQRSRTILSLSSDVDRVMIPIASGLRGLPQGLHDHYRFGMFCAIYTAVNGILGATFTALELATHDYTFYGAAGAAWTLSIIWGTFAAIMVIKVEVNRDRSYQTARDIGGYSTTRPRLLVGPGGVTIRF